MTTGDALGRMDSDTDAAPDTDTDDPDLRARVAELEATVAAQQQTITKMLPGRRGVLKAGALLGGGALVGAGTASAGTNQAGIIGSQGSPVDIESEDINNADTVTTQDLVVNGTATGPFNDFNFELLDTINSTISANTTKSLSATGNSGEYLLSFNFKGRGNGDPTFLRFNGKTSSNYSFNVLETNSIENRTGQDKFDFIQMQNGLPHTGSYIISDIGSKISISGTGFAVPQFNRFSLLNGFISGNMGDLSTVSVLAGPSQIDLSGDAKIELFGRK